MMMLMRVGSTVSAVTRKVYDLIGSPTIPAIPLLTAAGYVLAESAAAERLVGEVPLGPAFLVPLPPRGEFAPHEQELLAGAGPHVGVEQPQVRELLRGSSRHLREERFLPGSYW